MNRQKSGLQYVRLPMSGTYRHPRQILETAGDPQATGSYANHMCWAMIARSRATPRLWHPRLFVANKRTDIKSPLKSRHPRNLRCEAADTAAGGQSFRTKVNKGQSECGSRSARRRGALEQLGQVPMSRPAQFEAHSGGKTLRYVQRLGTERPFRGLRTGPGGCVFRLK